jgi:hypothetical protein
VQSFLEGLNMFGTFVASLFLSSSYQSNCASCHGRTGGGKVGPDLHKVSYETFVYSVRNGRAPIMPVFNESKYADADLQQDYKKLTGEDPVRDPKTPVDLVGFEPSASPSLHYLDEKKGPFAKGLGFALDPFVLPYRICNEKNVCANAGVSGSAPEGEVYGDFGVCKDVRTQRPYRKVEVVDRSGLSEAELTSDPMFMSELKWVTDQSRASACSCCHDSKVTDKVAYWDVSQGKVWTNQLDKYAVAVFSGKVSSAALGTYPAADNFGFDRYHTALPTIDVPRMQAFFDDLLLRMKVTDAEIEKMPPLADFIGKQLRKISPPCGSGVGVDNKTGKISWGLLPARYVYVLHANAQTPVVTPNLDKPVGTLWRIDQSREAFLLFSGTFKYGEVPPKATQTIPDPDRFDEVPQLQRGQKYKLVAQFDMGFPVQNCLFTY